MGSLDGMKSFHCFADEAVAHLLRVRRYSKILQNVPDVLGIPHPSRHARIGARRWLRFPDSQVSDSGLSYNSFLR